MKQIAHLRPRDLAFSIEVLESRIAPAFGAVVELAVLTGPDGFQINGEVAGDRSGFSVSAAGDVNGDGFDDIIIGADAADPNGSASGVAYVVFGRNTFDATLELASLTGTDGFRINGEAAGDLAGRSVSTAGDVNGDGFDDLIIGAPRADANGIDSGATYVLFGRHQFPPILELAALDGANGFKISGEAAGDHFGRSVSSAGDINGDSFDDVIIGAPAADPNGNASGAAYVIFGKSNAFLPTVQVANLVGTDGFQINGEARGDRAGRAVSGAGDVDRDGFEDVLIGAFRADPNGNQSGASYVIFGGPTFLPTFELSTLVGTNGFQINGESAGDFAGRAVSGARDIDGDGFSDVLIGAPGADPNGEASGASYVVFGGGTVFPATIELSLLTGSNGFQINGEVAGDQSGHAVSAAGDINSDNVSDLLIGAPFADPHGDASGASYVVFGDRDVFPAVIELSGLTGANGFRVNGEFPGDLSGRSVSTAGDINGDGFSDLLIGAPAADPHGSVSGASYIVFGQPSFTTFNSFTPSLFSAADTAATADDLSSFAKSGPTDSFDAIDEWLTAHDSLDPATLIASIIASSKRDS